MHSDVIIPCILRSIHFVLMHGNRVKLCRQSNLAGDNSAQVSFRFGLNAQKLFEVSRFFFRIKWLMALAWWPLMAFACCRVLPSAKPILILDWQDFLNSMSITIVLSHSFLFQTQVFHLGVDFLCIHIISLVKKTYWCCQGKV